MNKYKPTAGSLFRNQTTTLTACTVIVIIGDKTGIVWNLLKLKH